MYRKVNHGTSKAVGTIKLPDIGQTDFENLLREIESRYLAFSADYKMTETTHDQYRDYVADSVEYAGVGEWEKMTIPNDNGDRYAS